MKKWLKIVGAVVGGLFALLIATYLVFYSGGVLETAGEVHAGRVPGEVLKARTASTQPPLSPSKDKRILFGDLHVHTTFSNDAFVLSLPLLGGGGAHPPADACDFARYCAGLDFFALTDHAESLTPHHWAEIKASMRQCDATAGDPADPDIVAYTGWEWTNVGRSPADHYGHKNVIFKDLADDALPARPIASPGLAGSAMQGSGVPILRIAAIPITEYGERQRYLNLGKAAITLGRMDHCPRGVDSRALPEGCREYAKDPAQLFEKLDQWGFDTLVIPHGTTWGYYTPPGYTWDKQLSASMDDAEKQGLFEIFSGHGNSEEYRDVRAVTTEADGSASCPEPTEGFEPCCQRAGEIIKGRCEASGGVDCEARAEEARRNYAEAGLGGHRTVPGALPEDWGACGQCRDCFEPAFNYRPAGSAQYVIARGNFEDPAAPRHVKPGFIASSDNHSARPGTGYKEVARRMMTEGRGSSDPKWDELVRGKREAPVDRSRRLTTEDLIKMAPNLVVETERQASFYLTGGLVAVHSAGRDRGAIWDALKRKEVYGTSGPRILLWFSAKRGDATLPMGSAVSSATGLSFEVRAMGAFVQKPGCPDWVTSDLDASEVERLCVGECYNPGDARHKIVRIEVVRIRPQVREDEPVAPLIEDTWRSFECEDEGAGCTVTFTDDDFETSARDAVYYVRAIQAATPSINGANLRCVDEACSSIDPCWGGYQTSADDDCLADTEDRAWSSPIFVTYDPALKPDPVNVEGDDVDGGEAPQ